MKSKITTLCFAFNENKILMGIKRRDFGKGKWNGFGGKVVRGGKIFEAAKRELFYLRNLG